MNFNKKSYLLYNAPDEAGVNKRYFETDFKIGKIGYKDIEVARRGFHFYKKKENFRSMRKFLERIGLL